ncbi:MAG: alginate O-acetyltransferase AlgX-related protein [Rubrivivax sp.]
MTDTALLTGIPAAHREVFLSLAVRDAMDDLRRAMAQPRPVLQAGTVSEDGAAIAGRDGWLFLHAGNNQWNEQAAGHLTLTPDGLVLWAALLQQRRQAMAQQGRRYAHLFVPEKSCVYPEWQREPQAPSPQRPVVQLMAHLAAQGVQDVHYPLAALRAGIGLAPTFHRGNSHWTAWGAYLACRALWPRLGIEVSDTPPPLLQRPAQQDLSVKFDNQADENWHELDVGPWLAYTNEAQVPGHQGRFKHLHNPQAQNHCRVLIFGDSYAYDAHLAAWFALQCRDVFCVWQLGVQQTLIDQLSPDVVITEMAERFATRLPVDQLPSPSETLAAVPA